MSWMRIHTVWVGFTWSSGIGGEGFLFEMLCVVAQLLRRIEVSVGGRPVVPSGGLV